MGQVHVLTGIVRRRRWSVEEKRALVAEAFAPGAVLAEVARRADVHCGQLYRWRKELGGSAAVFMPVVVAPAVSSVGGVADLVIDVVVGDGGRVRLPAGVSPELAAAVIGALRRPQGRP